MTHILKATEITRSYGKKRAVDNLSLTLEEGCVHALIGESGSGKTTLSRILGGVEKAFTGQLQVAPDKHVVMVQQDFVIWPELSVLENISIGCRSKEGQRRLVPRIIDLIELKDRQSCKAGQLSYGQQQRVAIARALAAGPDIIILDEPFAHLDIWLRERIWSRSIEIFKEMGVTSLWVTHIVQDALSVADTVMVMVEGRLAQAGSPQNVYRQPNSHSVARLTGPYSCFSKIEWQKMGFDPEHIFTTAVNCVGCRPEQLKLVEDPAGAFSGSDLKPCFLGPITVYALTKPNLRQPLWMTSAAEVNPSKKYRLERVGSPFILE